MTVSLISSLQLHSVSNPENRTHISQLFFDGPKRQGQPNNGQPHFSLQLHSVSNLENRTHISRLFFDDHLHAGVLKAMFVMSDTLHPLLM
jgi:hypothetical protein